MELYFFRKLNDPYFKAFGETALQHNVKVSKVFAAIVGAICLVLCLVNLFTGAHHVLLYPDEYSAAVTFLFIASALCYLAFFISKRLKPAWRTGAHKFLTVFYALVVLGSSLWITFTMQHNPGNTMTIFILGIMSVATLWIFAEVHALVIALLLSLLFDSGLHFFQTDSCKLFANYITGTCASILFVFISRISFSVNYNHFRQLKKIEHNQRDIMNVNQVQTEMLAVVAHDLKGPVNSIISLVDMIKHFDTKTKEKNEHFDFILDYCQRSQAMIEDLLKVARQDAIDISFVDTCLNDFIDDALRQFATTRSRERVKSKARCSRKIIFNRPEEKIYARINHQKMTRVLENLLDNAWKFIEKNGMITVTLQREANNITIEVADNGIGIPGEFMPFLFQRFTRAGRTGLNGEKSHGLGMSICQLIMKQHHGDISATSEEGQGTQIKLTLPYSK